MSVRCPRLTAVDVPALVAAAAVCLALSLAISYGTLHPWALALASATLLATLLALLFGQRCDPLPRPGVAVGILGIGLAVSIVHNLLYLPGVLVVPARLGAFRPATAAAGAVLLSYLWQGAPRWLVRRRFPALVALAVLLGATVIRAAPSPGIDVWVIQQRGALALLSGLNPYEMPYPNLYGPGTPLIDASLLSPDGRYVLAYPYMPLTLLLDAPSAWLGDVRWTMLCAVAASAFLVRRLGRGSVAAELAAALLLFQPQAFFVLEMAWTEPVVLAGVLLAVLAVDAVVSGGSEEGRVREKDWLLPGLAGAAAAATKQYVPLLLLPLLFALPARARLKAALVAAIGACATLLPFLVWDPRSLLRGVLEFQLRQPLRADALSWPAAVVAFGGPALPSWPAFVLAGLCLAVTLRRTAGVGGAVLASAATWFVFVLFNKQAFCNYYWLAVGLLCAAVAVLTRWAEASDPGARQPGCVEESS